MKRIVIVAMCLCTMQCLAQSTPPDDIKALKAKYEQGLAAIQEDANKALTNSVQGYTDALKALGQKLQGAGDLDGILAVERDAERFGNEKTIPEGAVVTDCVALRDLQLKWQKMLDAIDISKSKKLVTLSRSHIAALEEVKKQLTMQGKVDEAVEAKNEIERVRTSAEVTAAEFVLTIDLAAKTNAVAKVSEPRRVDPLASMRSSLVLYYSFDRDEGGRVTDKSGKKNNGKVKGAKWTSKGKVGGAYRFNGNGGCIRATGYKGETGASPWTISVWARLSDTAAFPILCTWGTDGVVAGGVVGLVFYPVEQNRFVLGLDAARGVSIPSEGLADGSWHHFAGTYDGTTAKLYVDGLFRGEDAISMKIDNTHDFTIGAHAFRGANYFNGSIDEVMVFNRARSETEIKKIYDAQK